MPDDPRKPNEMDRVVAAKCLLNDAGLAHRDPGAEVAAFMAIFHPDHPTTDELIRDARRTAREGRER